MDIKSQFAAHFANGAQVARILAMADEGFDSGLERAVGLLRRRIQAGSKVFAIGNGGSAAMAEHFVAELVGYFGSHDERPLPAIALTANTAFLTAWVNDNESPHELFSRQVMTLGQEGDVLLAFTTSGRSPNILAALSVAMALRMRCIVLTGAGHGPIDASGLADVVIHAPAVETRHIQEAHLAILHAICKCLVDLR